MINYWNGREWEQKTKEYFKGVKKLENVESIFNVTSCKIEVQYKNGEIIYYTDIHGTWGRPTITK